MHACAHSEALVLLGLFKAGVHEDEHAFDSRQPMAAVAYCSIRSARFLGNRDILDANAALEQILIRLAAMVPEAGRARVCHRDWQRVTP